MTSLVTFTNVANGRIVFFFGRFVDAIELVLASADPIGRYHHSFQAINFLELVGFCVGRPCHAAQLSVQTEIVLEGDGGHGLVFSLNGHAFLGLHSLVQAIAPAATRHETPREFVNDDDLAFLHHIVLIAVIDVLGAQGRREVVHERNVGGIVKACTFGNEPRAGQNAFGFFVPLFGQEHLV